MRDLVGDSLTILVDPGGRAIAELGLCEVDADTGKTAARPSAFLVDAQRTVRYRYIGKAADDRPKNALLMLGIETMRAVPTVTRTGQCRVLGTGHM